MSINMMPPTETPEQLRKKYLKEYYYKNKEKIIEKTKEYYQKNKERLTKQKTEYYRKNKNKILESQAEYYRKNKNKILQYGKEYRQKNKERKAEVGAEYYRKNKNKILQYGKEYRQKNKEKKIEQRKKIKLIVINYYSNGLARCNCCGESDLCFLSIDHLNGGGGKHRKENKLSGGSSMYQWLVRNNFPDGFQVLCHNCNMAKGFFGKCPHQKEMTLYGN